MQSDVLDVVDCGWDLAVFFPPCTYLTKAGVRWLHEDAGRWEEMLDAATFFRRLLEVPIPRVAIENPVMHRYAVKAVGRRHTQVVQPWMFGHLEQKATGLWLRGLPQLQPTDDVKDRMLELPEAQRQRVTASPDSVGRAHRRSLTYRGLAEAMASQWG